jgi:hypothetical protein
VAYNVVVAANRLVPDTGEATARLVDDEVEIDYNPETQPLRFRRFGPTRRSIVLRL